MSRNIHLLLFLLCFQPLFSAMAQIPTPAFANRFGGSGSDYGYTLRTYPDGSSVFTGVFASSVTLAGVTYTSQGGSDAFVGKTNASGEVLWAKILSGPGDQLLSQLAIDGQGNVVVVGEYVNNASFAGTALTNSGGKDALVAKLDVNGGLTWVKTANNADMVDYNEVACDTAGNVYAFGQFKGTLDIGSASLTATGTGEDVCLVKYGPSGDVVWAKRYGNGATNALAIWASPLGECTIAGTFLGTLTFGTTSHPTNGSSDIYLAKLDVNGDPVWSRAYGGSSVDNPFAITGDAQGNVFLSGCFMQTMAVGSNSLISNGQWDVFTAKILPNGDAGWAVSFGGTDNDRANDICLDASGNVYMFGWYQQSMAVGTTTLTSLGEYDVFLLKLQPNGTPVWAYSYGGNSFDVGAALAMDAAGNIYMMGDFWSADFAVGNLNLSPTSGNDIFMIRLGTTTGIEPYSAMQPGLLRQIPAEPGWIQVEAATPGQLQVVSLQGRLVYEKAMQPGRSVSFPTNEKLLLYRFESQGKTVSGKWVGK